MNQILGGRRFAAACCTAIFLAACSLPLGSQLLGISPHGKLAEATGSPFPEFEWSRQSFRAMGKSLADGWLEKNFPYRGELIRWYNYASATLFGSLANNSPVVVGKEGWLFLSRDRSLNVLEEHRAVTPLTEAQVASVAAKFQARADWCAERGIRYLVAVAPNKESIYPEHLPDEYAQVGPVSRMDQIMAHIREKTRLDVLDLRPALMEAKKGRQVFYATDSHWNAYGAFPAYRAIIERLGKDFPALTPMNASDFFFQEFTFLGGDLSYMVGVEDLITEKKVYMIPKSPLRARGVSVGTFKTGYSQPAQGSERPGAGLPKAVVFHDSFFWEIAGFLGEHFSRAVYVWVKPGLDGAESIFDKELIEAEKPDVVVEQIAERFFLPVVQKGAGQGAAQ